MQVKIGALFNTLQR